MKSIIQSKKERCFWCKRNARADYFGLDEHHVFFGPYRRKSEKYGLKVYLCHDTCHLNGVHKHREMDIAIKRYVQKKAMEKYGWTKADFIREFGQNYL